MNKFESTVKSKPPKILQASKEKMFMSLQAVKAPSSGRVVKSMVALGWMSFPVKLVPDTVWYIDFFLVGMQWEQLDSWVSCRCSGITAALPNFTRVFTQAHLYFWGVATMIIQYNNMTNYLIKYFDLGDWKCLAASEFGALTEDFRQVFRVPPGGHYLAVFWTSSWRVNLAVLQTTGALVWSRWVLLSRDWRCGSKGRLSKIHDEDIFQILRCTYISAGLHFYLSMAFTRKGKTKWRFCPNKLMENKTSVMPDLPPPFSRLQPSQFHSCGTKLQQKIHQKFRRFFNN